MLITLVQLNFLKKNMKQYQIKYIKKFKKIIQTLRMNNIYKKKY